MSKAFGRSHLIGNGALIGIAMLAALGCYTISLKVSSERAAVAKMRTQIVADAHDVRMLQSELRTRARLPELQRWNDSVLALSPPSAQQFVHDQVQLASYAPDAARPSAPIQRAPAPVPVATAPTQLTPAQPTPAPLLPATPRAANQLAPGMKSINYAVPNVSRIRLGAASSVTTAPVALTAPHIAAEHLTTAQAMPATGAPTSRAAVSNHAGLDSALVETVAKAAASAPAAATPDSPGGPKAPME